jgi:anthranilate phosphoribosyltransferase
MVDGAITPNQAAAVLAALAARGEHYEEIAGAVRAMRARCVRLEYEAGVLVDIVGTGGDGKGTINVSTMAALVVAAAGIPVAKHGNRAASGICGSADVLESAGFRVELEPEVCVRMLRETNFAFLFAPRYHPSMRAMAPIRRELGVRTIFNYLGPLTNPASPTHQVVGVATKEAMGVVARVFEMLGMRGAVIHGCGGLDEVAGEGVSECLEFTGGAPIARSIDPGDFGIRVPSSELAGPSVSACRDAFLSILGGERSPRAEVVALNAAVAIASARALGDLRTALDEALQTLRSGEPLRVFERARAIARG